MAGAENVTKDKTLQITNKKYFRALLILAVGVLISWLIIVAKPTPEPSPHEAPPPHVADVVPVILESQAITVASQGTVTPKIAIEITSQVSGEVVFVGKHFAAGGYFAKGEVLAKLDPRDYEIAVIRAEANLAEAKRVLAQEKGQALQAKREWRDLGNEAANELFLRKPQLAAAEASVKAAEADLRQAKLDLERTEISLPFAGRVVSVAANLGQYVNSGATLGSVYASDIMEVRLPLTAAQLKLLNLHGDGQFHELSPLNVDLYLEAGANLLHWKGDIVRLESEVDTRSRLFYLVAEIDNRVTEYTDEGKPIDRSPVLPGTFVEARITSNPHKNVMVLPRSALYQNDRVLILDEENRLRVQRVTVLQVDEDSLVVQGLEEGRQVLAKPPSFMELGAVYEARHYSAGGEQS